MTRLNIAAQSHTDVYHYMAVVYTHMNTTGNIVIISYTPIKCKPVGETYVFVVPECGGKSQTLWTSILMLQYVFFVN